MACSPAKGRILICDDERGIREILSRLVRGEGYEPCEVADGRAALAAIRQREPDVLFLDVRMPGLNGLEVLRRARALAPTMPIVLITTSIVAPQSADCCDEPQRYVLKPFRHEEVVRSLRDAMDERQALHTRPIAAVHH